MAAVVAIFVAPVMAVMMMPIPAALVPIAV